MRGRGGDAGLTEPGRGWPQRVTLAAVGALVLAGCSDADDADVAVPELDRSTTSTQDASEAPVEDGASDEASPPDSAPATLPEFERVSFVGDQPTVNQVAVLTGFGLYMDDWMAVAASPRDPVATSAHAQGAAQESLATLAGNLVEAGNSIDGTLLVDDVSLGLDPAGGVNGLTACLDQSDVRLVGFDGAELEGEAEQRIGASAAVVLAGDAWLVSALDITTTPC